MGWDDLTNGSGGVDGRNWLKLKDGGSRIVAFIGEPRKVYKAYRLGEPMKLRFVFQLADLEDGGKPLLWETNGKHLSTIATMHKDGLLEQPVKIERQGSGQTDTTYPITGRGESKWAAAKKLIDARDDWYDLDEVIADWIAAGLSPAPGVPPSKGTPKVSSGKASADAGDDIPF